MSLPEFSVRQVVLVNLVFVLLLVAGTQAARRIPVDLFPDISFNGGNYWVDVTITTDSADNTRPVVDSVSPTQGATGAYVDTSVTATFNEDIDPGSVQMTVQAGGNPVAGTVSVDGKKVLFSPTDLFPANTQVSVSLNATDGYGNALAQPRTWTFTTGTTLAPCPCTLFGQRTPATVSVRPVLAKSTSGLSPAATSASTPMLFAISAIFSMSSRVMTMARLSAGGSNPSARLLTAASSGPAAKNSQR